MKVTIRESAYADLERIYRWIAQDSPRNAASVVDHICNSIDNTLAFFLSAGHRGKARDTYEWVSHGLPYVVVYQIDVALDELIVVAIFHGAQDR